MNAVLKNVDPIAVANKKLEAARATLERMREAAADAEAEAQRARKAYDASSPRDRNLKLDSEVAADEAVDRRAAVERYEEEVVWKLETERKQAQFDAAAAAHDQQVQRIEQAMDRAVEAIVNAAKQLDAAVAEYEELNKLRLEGLKLGWHPLPFGLGPLLDQASAKLRKGLPPDRTYPHTTQASLFPYMNQADGFVTLHLTRPITKVPGVFR